MIDDGSSRGSETSGKPVGMGRAGMPSGVNRVGMAGGMSRPGIPSGPRRRVAPGGPNTRWPQYVQYMIVVGLTLLFLFLAVEMQQHHFLSGEFYGRSHPTEQ